MINCSRMFIIDINVIKLFLYNTTWDVLIDIRSSSVEKSITFIPLMIDLLTVNKWCASSQISATRIPVLTNKLLVNSNLFSTFQTCETKWPHLSISHYKYFSSFPNYQSAWMQFHFSHLIIETYFSSKSWKII